MIARLFPLGINWEGFGGTRPWPLTPESLLALIKDVYLTQLTQLVFGDRPLTKWMESQEES